MGIPASLLQWSKLESATCEVGPNFATTGTFIYEACKFNNGGRGNVDGYLLSNITGMFVSPNAGCIELWIKPSAASGVGFGYTPIFQYSQSVSNFVDLVLYETGMYFHLRANNVWSRFDNVSSWSAGELFHVAIAWDGAGISPGKTVACYKNGVEIGSLNNAVAFSSNLTSGYLGYVPTDWGPGVNFNAPMDNIKVWNYGKIDFTDKDTEGYTTALRRFAGLEQG